MTLASHGKAVVIGGSMAGLFAAHFLRRAGWRVEVFERTSGPLSGRGAGIMTHPQLRAALETLGLPTVENFGVPITTRVAIDRSGHVLMTRHFPQIATAWTRVHSLLSDAFPRAHYHAGMEFESFAADAQDVRVRFADGHVETADLLVGADGFRSSVRRQLFPSLAPEYAGYVGWRGMLPEAEMDSAPFALTSQFTFDLPDGEHMIGYPVAGPGNQLTPGQRNYNFVWYRPADASSELPALLTDGDGQRHELSIPPILVAPAVVDEMRCHANRVLSPWFRDVVARTSQPFFQPIYDLAVPRMAEGRVVLVGDAAFVVRPHVGAGVLKAADDAQALVAALGDRHGNLVQQLQTFSYARVPVGVKMIARARDLGSYISRSFANEAERLAAAAAGAPERVLAETAALEFLDT